MLLGAILIRNIRHWHVQLMLLERVLARCQHFVAFRKAMKLLHGVMHMVSYRHTLTAIKTASKVGSFIIDVLFAVALAAAGAIQSK